MPTNNNIFDGMQKPSDRILIKIIQINSIAKLRVLQAKTEPETFFTIHFYVRLYLVLVNLLSGCFGGMTSTMGKMFLQVCSFEHGWSVVYNPMAWVTGLSVVFTVFSNLANLNATLRLYSQLMVMPTYECCIILGTLLSGGIVMNEFSYYG